MYSVLRRFLFVVVSAVFATGQAQVKANPQVQVNIGNPQNEVGVFAGKTTMRHQYGAFALACDDKNDVLLEVLTSIADPDFLKQELEYEKKNDLDFEGIYKRRLGVIKVLAGKK